MENEDIKVGDCARLKFGATPDYTVSAINGTTATCVWFDRQKRKTVTEELPLSALKKHTPPEPLSVDDVMKAFRR